MSITTSLTDSHSFDLKINQVTKTITTTAPPIQQTCQPIVVFERLLFGGFYVNPPHADTFVVKARKIRLTADPTPVAAIEGVVPNIQFDVSWSTNCPTKILPIEEIPIAPIDYGDGLD